MSPCVQIMTFKQTYVSWLWECRVWSQFPSSGTHRQVRMTPASSFLFGPLKCRFPGQLTQASIVCKQQKVSSSVQRLVLIFTTSLLLHFPGGSAGKESACNAGDMGSIPGLGRIPGEGNGYPLQYSGLENFMDCSIVCGVTRTWLSNFHSLLCIPL